MVIQIEKAMESKESQMRNLSYLQSTLKQIVAFTSLSGLNTFSLEVCMIGCRDNILLLDKALTASLKSFSSFFFPCGTRCFETMPF